ncbi:Hypothetical protein CpCap5W_2066 [Corynebacterium pseudotuberculosis]|nr:Hypothetical protein Cp3995_0657 [Corynebacterium pseudotuberculosis 3/99-5]AFH51578.1 Hypothetical protein Cp267_0676 [Corynebacterium pseudotuberculosis 267]ARS61508.1 Hypothetical protein CpATCC19410_2102 [Corynebacterium pseudotuberculosis]AZN22953.1 Hypothetical protein CpOviAF1_2063 [Corynebacterium pseudotuberculosis]QBB91988.1 hypothetical protein CpCR07_2068 [Corynebacterium pseudotuberculosis]
MRKFDSARTVAARGGFVHAIVKPEKIPSRKVDLGHLVFSL